LLSAFLRVKSTALSANESAWANLFLMHVPGAVRQDHGVGPAAQHQARMALGAPNSQQKKTLHCTAIKDAATCHFVANLGMAWLSREHLKTCSSGVLLLQHIHLLHCLVAVAPVEELALGEQREVALGARRSIGWVALWHHWVAIAPESKSQLFARGHYDVVDLRL
jgi:hypothetical protein